MDVKRNPQEILADFARLAKEAGLNRLNLEYAYHRPSSALQLLRDAGVDPTREVEPAGDGIKITLSAEVVIDGVALSASETSHRRLDASKLAALLNEVAA